MTASEKNYIRNKIANNHSEHLNGFDRGWLLIKEHDMRFGRIFQIFTVEDFKPILVDTLVC